MKYSLRSLYLHFNVCFCEEEGQHVVLQGLRMANNTSHPLPLLSHSITNSIDIKQNGKKYHTDPHHPSLSSKRFFWTTALPACADHRQFTPDNPSQKQTETYRFWIAWPHCFSKNRTFSHHFMKRTLKIFQSFAYAQHCSAWCAMSASFYSTGASFIAFDPDDAQEAPKAPSSSFYPSSGVVGSAKAAAVVDSPWTRKLPAPTAEERPSSRERRHRSSWHAALNKRLIQIEDAEELLCIADEMLTGLGMQQFYIFLRIWDK